MIAAFICAKYFDILGALVALNCCRSSINSRDLHTELNARRVNGNDPGSL